MKVNLGFSESFIFASIIIEEVEPNRRNNFYE